MDVTALHAATEELAGYFSELTVGDLHRPTERYRRGIGELIEQLMAEDVRLAAELPSTESILPASEAAAAEADFRIATKVAAPDLFGGGFESGYRRTAALVEAAFSAAPDADADLADRYRQRVADLRRHVNDLAMALGLDEPEAVDGQPASAGSASCC